jgi:hypothetical protein
MHKKPRCCTPDHSPKPHLVVSEVRKGIHGSIHEGGLEPIAKRLNLNVEQVREELEKAHREGRINKRGRMYIAD